MAACHGTPLSAGAAKRYRKTPCSKSKKYLSIGENRSASFFLWQGGWAAFFMIPNQTTGEIDDRGLFSCLDNRELGWIQGVDGSFAIRSQDYSRGFTVTTWNDGFIAIFNSSEALLLGYASLESMGQGVRGIDFPGPLLFLSDQPGSSRRGDLP